MFHAEILFPCTRVVSFPAFAVMVWLLVVAFCCLPAELKAEVLVNNLLFEWQHPSSWTSALHAGRYKPFCASAMVSATSTAVRAEQGRERWASCLTKGRDVPSAAVFFLAVFLALLLINRG